MNDQINRVRENNPLVRAILRAGGTMEDCVIALDEVQANLTRQVMELSSIAPKAFRLSSGTIVAWHCPNELIPVVDLTMK